MNLTWLNNILEHPYTTAVGIATAVIVIAGALQQQGVHLHWLSVLAAVLAALLGAFAKDPGTPKSAA